MSASSNKKEKFDCFKNQDFYTLSKIHNENNLFEDPYFPAQGSSIFFTRAAPKNIVWKRPKEINKNAQFVIDGYSRLDICQGNNGNCWFIAGCIAVIESKPLFDRVVPKDQSFSENYNGLFHFRFYCYGRWIDIVV